MEELQMSSCSFPSDEEESQKSVQDEFELKQTEIEQNHLREVNSQLQANIESLKGQLKDAMDTASTVTAMTEAINDLNGQLAQAHENERQSNEEINRLTKQNEEALAKANGEIQKAQQEKEEMAAQLEAQAQKVNKMRKERNNAKEHAQERDQEVESLAIELKDSNSKKRKLKNKFIGIADKLQKANEDIAQLTTNLEEAESENSRLAQENEALKSEIDSIKNVVSQKESDIEQGARSLEKKEKAIKQLEEQLEQQTAEMEEIIQERQNTIMLIHKMHSSIAFAEQKIEDLNKENEKLRKAKKGSSTTTRSIGQSELDSISMPFEGDMGERAVQIMQLPQYQPTQRLQILINEAAKNISKAEEEIRQKDAELEVLRNQYDAAVNGQTPYCQILDGLLRELKNISCSEAQINNANVCRVDTKFIEFMAEKSAEIEPLIRDDLLSDPRFIPSDFFSTQDLQTRLDAINSIIETSDVSYSIFVSTFLTNILLSNQMQSLMGPLGKMEEISHLDVLHDGDISNIPGLITGLQKKIENLKKTRSQLHALLKNSQEQLAAVSKDQHELKTRCQQLEITNDSLQSELEVVKVKLHVTSNELLLKKNEDKMNEFAEQLKQDVNGKQAAAKEQAERLEKELEEKQKECDNMTNLIKKLQVTIEENSKKQGKRFARTEAALKEQIADMQQQLEMMDKELAMRKKKAKRTERSLREQYDASLADVQKNYENSKGLLLKTIEDLKGKAEEARDISKKLQQNVSESAEKNKHLVEVNEATNEEKRNLQQQLTQLKNQVAKDKQNAQIKEAAQNMEIENRIQMASKAAREEQEKRIAEILTIAAESLGEHYGCDESEFNEDAYKQVIAHAKEDLERLQYFQEEATRI